MGFVFQRHYFCSRTAEKDSKQPAVPANDPNALSPSTIVFAYNRLIHSIGAPAAITGDCTQS